jgi:hypothetical protein
LRQCRGVRVVDFDLHKRAEVDRGLRTVKGDKDIGAAGFSGLTVPLRKNGFQENVRVGEGYAEHMDFIGDAH